MRFQSKSVSSLILASAMCSALLLSANSSHAAASIVLSPTDPAVGTACASLGGAWDGSTKCTLGRDLTLNPGDSLVVDPNANLAVPAGITLTNGGAIQDYGTIETGTGGFLTNSGNITAFIANGTLINQGTMTNEPKESVNVEHSGQTSVEVGEFNFTNTGTSTTLGRSSIMGISRTAPKPPSRTRAVSASRPPR